METRQLGHTGPTTGELGLGCMGMSDLYGTADRGESISTIHAAIDAGMTLIDTGDFYGMGHNEMLIGEAIKQLPRDSFQISVKFGALRDPVNGWGGVDGSRAAVRNFVAYSLKRLGTEYIDIYRMARLDPDVPIEETVGAIGELIDEGYVRHVGLSELGAGSIRRAHAAHAVSDLQIEYSLISRGIEDEILPTCEELGIGITAYAVLSRGLLGGHWSPDKELAATDFRSHSPRFSGENLQHNLALVEELRAVAEAKGCTVAQLAIAWVLSRGDQIVPIIGARTIERLNESIGAVEVEFSADEIERIEAAVPNGAAAGDRYAAAQMANLDSER
jgi:aryl-alcohol dehydrogenase-like predicted oxidoreductase